MAKRTLYVLSGISLIIGGTAGVVAHILHLQYHPTYPEQVLPYVTKSEPVHVLLFAAVLLVLLGLPGLLIRQHERAGVLGLLGFALVYFGLMLAEGLHCVLEFGIYPAMAHKIPNEMIGVVNHMYESGSPYAHFEMAGGALLLLGVLILGISMLVARVFPRWTALLFLATDVTAALAFIPSTHWLIGGRFPLMLYLAFVAVGYSVIARAAAAQIDIEKVVVPA